MGFIAALRFLTILPLPLRREPTADEVGASLPYFPLVGLLLGMALWGLDETLSLVLSGLVVNVLLLAALVVLTGALHLDGFIDTCDGAAPRRTPAERLAIMADSRVGAFGVAGGCLLLLLKLGALYSLPGEGRYQALLLMPVLGRWAMTYAVFANPYARGASGKGFAFKKAATAWRAGFAALLALVISFGVTRDWHGPALMAGVWVVALWVAWYVRSRLGGLTGDSYGAIDEVAEMSVLLVFPLVWRLV